MDSIEELNKDSIVIRGLDYDNTYEFRVVAVDGKHTTPSEVESIYTYSKVFKFCKQHFVFLIEHNVTAGNRPPLRNVLYVSLNDSLLGVLYNVFVITDPP